MNKSNLQSVMIALTIILSFASLGRGQSKAAYTVVRLAFPGAAAASTESHGLNDQGNVVGTYRDTGGVQRGFHYKHSTKTYQSLGAGVTAAGINQLEELVGTDDLFQWGLYWSSPSATPTPLLPLVGHTHSRAYAINDAGIIVGSSYIPEESPVTPNYRAIVVWRVDAQGDVSEPIVLPYPAGDLRGGAGDLTAQDDFGVTTIVGSTGDTTTFPRRAVQWSVVVDQLGGLSLRTGPTELGGNYAEATDINFSGNVVGSAVFSGDGASWPYLKPAGQPLVALAAIPKAKYGAATSINDAGKIVGSQSYLNQVHRAVLWTSPTKVIDLNSQVTLGRSETLTWAAVINNRGDILASINSNTGCLLIAK